MQIVGRTLSLVRMVDRDKGGDVGRCSTEGTLMGEINTFILYSKVYGQPVH